MPDSPKAEEASLTAFVTGAGIRVGRAIALELARAGYDVILHAHSSRASLETLAREIRDLGRDAFMVSADLSDPAEVERLAHGVRDMHPRLDLVVHNAGIYEARPFDRVSREDYRRMQAINVEAPFFLTQQLLPSLNASPAPSVIHLGDIGGERPVPGFSHYSVSKAALLMLTKALAVELAPKIRVNAISPGTVAFPPGLDSEAKQEILDRIPMEREGTVEDVAKAVVFLARHAPYVTGHVLDVDGGRSAML
ncbi:SDR family NAD(P)-dependent oxidoreductase [Vulgatibacter incomptus]|uniref:FolM Alternative dihydrofolate reductase 1 n=1 Tax=Vulgatibacter incomptus TaxID=1391653 RepID=A0A0K1PHD1_9BACT|nr:SDR family oxidoreductase [Vulgatibacter incomptus]AKU92948.1 FolM Alternative dihydrofolate reductase 1 [Vulgatibacter incomptus]